MCVWYFLGAGRREEKPHCIKMKLPEWQKGKLGNIPNALFSYLRIPLQCLELKLSVLERRTPAREGIAFLVGKHLQFGRTW